jgi:hypothetical protein
LDSVVFTVSTPRNGLFQQPAKVTPFATTELPSKAAAAGRLPSEKGRSAQVAANDRVSHDVPGGRHVAGCNQVESGASARRRIGGISHDQNIEQYIAKTGRTRYGPFVAGRATIGAALRSAKKKAPTRISA